MDTMTKPVIQTYIYAFNVISLAMFIYFILSVLIRLVKGLIVINAFHALRKINSLK